MMTIKSLSSSAALALALLTLSSTVTAADAAPAIIAKDGIAFSRTDNGSIVAYDPVEAYDNHQTVIANCQSHKVSLQGVSWCFSNGENAQIFLAATGDNGRNKYVPFGGGHCAMGLSVGNLTAAGDPRTAVRIGNELVLNGSMAVRTMFLGDTERNMDNGRLRYQLGLELGTIVPNE